MEIKYLGIFKIICCSFCVRGKKHFALNKIHLRRYILIESLTIKISMASMPVKTMLAIFTVGGVVVIRKLKIGWEQLGRSHDTSDSISIYHHLVVGSLALSEIIIV